MGRKIKPRQSKTPSAEMMLAGNVAKIVAETAPPGVLRTLASIVEQIATAEGYTREAARTQAVIELTKQPDGSYK